MKKFSYDIIFLDMLKEYFLGKLFWRNCIDHTNVNQCLTVQSLACQLASSLTDTRILFHKPSLKVASVAFLAKTNEVTKLCFIRYMLPVSKSEVENVQIFYS